VLFRNATEWVAILSDAQRQGRLDQELARPERYPWTRRSIIVLDAFSRKVVGWS
jgi:hypothetical protein